MLIATPGQTASYALSSGTSLSTASTTTGTQKSSSTIKPNSNSSASANTSYVFNSKINTSIHNNFGSSELRSNNLADGDENARQSNGKSTSLIKSLTIRLSRGTETLKATVQRALTTATSVTRGDIKAAPNIINRLKVFSNDIIANSTDTRSHALTKKPSKNTTTTSANILDNNPVSSRLLDKCRGNRTFPNVYTATPTWTHRFPNQRRASSGSVDSLHKEMCHFKPIRAAPITPKKSRSKTRCPGIRFPNAIEGHQKSSCNVRKRNINIHQHSMDASKPIFHLKSGRNRALISRSHISAFACLMNTMEDTNENKFDSSNDVNTCNQALQTDAVEEDLLEEICANDTDTTPVLQSESTNSANEIVENKGEEVAEEIKEETPCSPQPEEQKNSSDSLKAIPISQPANIVNDGEGKEKSTNKRKSEHSLVVEDIVDEDKEAEHSSDESDNDRTLVEDAITPKRIRLRPAKAAATSRKRIKILYPPQDHNLTPFSSENSIGNVNEATSKGSNINSSNEGDNNVEELPASTRYVSYGRRLPNKRKYNSSDKTAPSRTKRSRGSAGETSLNSASGNTSNRRRLPKNTVTVITLAGRSSPPLTRARLKRLNEQMKSSAFQ